MKKIPSILFLLITICFVSCVDKQYKCKSIKNGNIIIAYLPKANYKNNDTVILQTNDYSEDWRQTNSTYTTDTSYGQFESRTVDRIDKSVYVTYTIKRCVIEIEK